MGIVHMPTVYNAAGLPTLSSPSSPVWSWRKEFLCSIHIIHQFGQYSMPKRRQGHCHRLCWTWPAGGWRIPWKNIITFGSFIVLGASSFVFLEGLCLVGLFAILALNFKAKRFFDVKWKLFILSLQESLYPIIEASLWQLSDALRGHGISLSFFFIAQHLQTIVV